MRTAWTIAPLLLAAAACGNSHSPDDDMGMGCHSDFAAPHLCFIDECCEATERATFDPTSCSYECTRGSQTCTPAPGCGTCGDEPDAGPVDRRCFGGPCCDDVMNATRNAECDYECPDGYSQVCEPDPSAFCAPSSRACEVPSDCVVTANTCCGECGQATLEGSTSVNEDFLETYRDSLCGDEEPICPACAQSPNPDLVPTCAGGICEVIDVGALSISECSSSDECRVRTVDCCECGGSTDPGSLIAIRTDAEGFYSAQVCDPEFGCPECAPVYPADVDAVCLDGRCTLVYEDSP